MLVSQVPNNEYDYSKNNLDEAQGFAQPFIENQITLRDSNEPI